MTSATNTWRQHEESGATPPENYERYFVPAIARPFALDLVERAAIQPGERVLDVACGTGVVARLAAERAGSGLVAGVDGNAGMLAVARASTPDEAGIRWYESAAESMPLPDASFNVALCQMSLPFFEDKGAALREIRRVLTRGGRALVSAPRQAPPFGVLEEALARHAGAQAAGFAGAVFSLGDADRVARLCREAGFGRVEVHTDSKALHLPRAEAFLWQYIGSTPLTGLVGPLEEERKVALERQVVDGWRPWSDAGGMAYEQEMVVARLAG